MKFALWATMLSLGLAVVPPCPNNCLLFTKITVSKVQRNLTRRYSDLMCTIPPSTTRLPPATTISTPTDVPEDLSTIQSTLMKTNGTTMTPSTVKNDETSTDNPTPAPTMSEQSTPRLPTPTSTMSKQSTPGLPTPTSTMSEQSTPGVITLSTTEKSTDRTTSGSYSETTEPWTSGSSSRTSDLDTSASELTSPPTKRGIMQTLTSTPSRATTAPKVIKSTGSRKTTATTSTPRSTASAHLTQGPITISIPEKSSRGESTQKNAQSTKTVTPVIHSTRTNLRSTARGKTTERLSSIPIRTRASRITFETKYGAADTTKTTIVRNEASSFKTIASNSKKTTINCRQFSTASNTEDKTSALPTTREITPAEYDSTIKKRSHLTTRMEFKRSTRRNLITRSTNNTPVRNTPVAAAITTSVQEDASSTRRTTGRPSLSPSQETPTIESSAGRTTPVVTSNKALGSSQSSSISTTENRIEPSTPNHLPTTQLMTTTDEDFAIETPSSTRETKSTTTRTVGPSQASSNATTGHGLHLTTKPYLTTTQQTTRSTELDLTTETSSTIPPWCNYDCPVEYIAAERGCYIMVPPDFRQNFMSALSWCRAESRRDLVDKEDLTTSNMIETLKHILRLRKVQSDIMYLNGHADFMMRKKRKAGLIHLEEISIWENLPYDYIGLSTDTVNVTGICRLPKFCEKPTCDLSDIYNLLPEKVVEVENRTMLEGSSIMLKCLPPSRDILSIRCVEPGELLPSPTLLNCTIPADIKYEPPEKEVPGNMRIRESCEECYRDGTDNCTAEGDGFLCNCKHGWNKFTCFKYDDLCPPQYCGPNGNCISQLDEFFCNCSAGWIGDTCDVDIKKITWSGNKTLRIISSNTIASGLLAVSSGIQISLKVLSKVITDKDPEAFRATCLTIGNLAIALFQHPDLLSQEPLSCRWFFFFVHICYSLAFVFMLDEVFNVCTTIHGLHRNNWVYDNRLQKRWWLDIPARIQFPFVLVFALLWFVASQGWSQIPTTWTCFGVFRRETSNIWYPLVLFNFICIVLCFGFAENARRTLSHRIQFWTANMLLIEVTNPYIRESIEKVRRNVPYCFLLPPFMFLNWLFLCWAADKQTDTVKYVSLLFSGIYTVLSLMQTIVTSTGVYEYVVFYGHLYLPNWISNRILQDLTPMTWLSKDEIVAKKKKTPFKELDAASPYHPASICYITLEHFHLILRRMTREYLDHRIVFLSTQDEATLSVYFNELRLRHVYEKNAPLEDLHLEYILETWIRDTKRIDQLTMPPKPKKQRETWRTRIRAKNRIPPKENTNIRRMRFLKTCMDYHLKTLNPTLEHPITGAMQRTDFRTFSPAYPCVLRSQVEDLQRMWLPVIDKYMQQDWSLREVYKEFQKKNGLQPREGKYECKKNDIDEDHWLNELRPVFIGPRSYPLVYLPALDTYLELDYYQRFADLEWARLVKHSEYMGSCYDFSR